MQGLIILDLGWTVPELDATPWPRVMELVDYLADHPSVRRLLAGFMGVKPRRKAKKAKKVDQPHDVQSIVNLMNGL